MAKVKNPARVLAGKKSWETKLKKMQESTAYKLRIQSGQKLGLAMAKLKRESPQGYEAFKQKREYENNYLKQLYEERNSDEWHSFEDDGREPTVEWKILHPEVDPDFDDDYYNNFYDYELESTILEEYLEGVMSFNPEFQSFLEEVYEDTLMIDYQGNEALLRGDIRARIDQNPALIGDSIETIETESKDNEYLRNAMYAIIQTICGTVPTYYAERIEIMANERIPPWFRKGRRNK